MSRAARPTRRGVRRVHRRRRRLLLCRLTDVTDAAGRVDAARRRHRVRRAPGGRRVARAARGDRARGPPRRAALRRLERRARRTSTDGASSNMHRDPHRVPSRGRPAARCTHEIGGSSDLRAVVHARERGRPRSTRRGRTSLGASLCLEVTRSASSCQTAVDSTSTGDERGSVRRQGCDRHRRGARHRPQPRAAARERGRGGRRERPRRQRRRRGRRRDTGAAGRRRDRRGGRPRRRELRQRLVVGRRRAHGRSRPSTRSAGSTCSSTTPASCATR